MKRNRKTKIICTIGPATKKADRIRELIKNGMNVARLNFSHGTHAEHLELIKNIRIAAESSGTEIPIIGDLSGPKVRIGKLSDEISLNSGETVLLSSTESSDNSGFKILPVTYEKLCQDVAISNRILIDDGLIELIIQDIIGESVYCRVVNGGMVRSGKGVNFPDSSLSTPSLTAKDKKDLDFALEHKLDFLALSFVRSSQDIVELKQILQARDSRIPVIAKIEKPQAIADIEQIIQSSDLIMIARGDLGVELNAHEVPILQKEIIRYCLHYNRPVITATQMLESMINNPRSTRAEASDIANALFDGTDAVMLSGETSIGLYPAAAVEVMNSILRRAEETDYIISHLLNDNSIIENPQFAVNLSKAACRIARDTNAAAIIAMTKTGRTARYLSKYRAKTPILAFSPNDKTVTRLKLSWGVESIFIESFGNTDEILSQAQSFALTQGLIKKDDIVVYVTGTPMIETEEINMIKIEKV
jgi:pyruvate kinase